MLITVLSVCCKDVNWFSQHLSWWCSFLQMREVFEGERNTPVLWNSTYRATVILNPGSNPVHWSLLNSEYLSALGSFWITWKCLNSPTRSCALDTCFRKTLNQNPEEKSIFYHSPKVRMHQCTKKAMAMWTIQAANWPGGRLTEGLGFQWSSWSQVDTGP